MPAHQLPHCLPGLGSGLGGHGTGVDHDNIRRLFGLDHDTARRLKTGLEGSGFILVNFAAKGCYCYFFHFCLIFSS
jgi:hypothetical protein